MRPSVPPELLDGVIRHLDPVEVWLFGSRARGDARPDSDWDLYVVVDDGTERERSRLSTDAVRAFRKASGLGVDVIVKDWSKSLVRRRAFGTLDETIDHEGERLYARAERPPVKEMPEVSSPSEWLGIGRGDAKMARLAIDNELLGHASYNIQQAWEKALKGRLALVHVRFGKTHNLKYLAGLVGAYSDAELARLKGVTDWGIESRYGSYPENDIATLEAELARAEAALDQLEAAITAT